MPYYQIVVARSAHKELQALPVSIAERLLKKIELLAKEPRPAGCKKLRGAMNLWRMRVGDYRVVYQIDDEKSLVDIVIIRHRSDAYR